MGNYFIRVDDAPELRRKLLESSKATLHILRSYQDLVKLRGVKHTLMKSLRRELKELTILVNRLEEVMPTLSKSELQAFNPTPKQVPKTRKPAPSQPAGKTVFVGKPETIHHRPEPGQAEVLPARKTPERPRTEAEKLQDALAAIERKLSNI